MKRKISLYLLAIIVATVLIISVTIGWHSNRLINNILENNKEDIFKQIENKIKSFDKYMFLIESQMMIHGEKALLAISQKFKQTETRHKSSPEELKRLALEHGVNDIYLIDKKGLIYNTSFQPDMKFNLFSIGEQFANFLKSIYGQGKVFKHRLSLSFKTGNINMYLYYSPKDADYIVEISIRAKTFIKNNYPSDHYDYLYHKLFASSTKENRYLKQVDIYNISQNTIWSIINENKSFPYGKDIINAIQNFNEYKIKEGDQVTILKKISFEKYDFKLGMDKYIEIKYDFSILSQFLKDILLYTILTAIIVSILFFLLFSKIFNSIFIKRIEKIDSAINKIEKDNYNTTIEDNGNDELSHIANSINQMTKIIGQRVERLHGLIPICANCKKVRDDKGYWQQVEQYVSEKSDADFSHTICPDCAKELYPDMKLT